MEQIFMVGTQRSGSNLLRVMLNQANIAGSHPAHVLKHLMPLVSGYGDLNKQDNFKIMVDDACRLVELNPVPWEGIDKYDRDDVMNRCSQNSPIAIFGALMDIYAEKQNKSSWLCKSLGYIRWTKELDDYFGSPKYLYLYRDARDVALSFKKAVIGEKHYYHLANQWAETQRLALKAQERIGPERFFAIQYEKLVSEPEQILGKLCQFLNIEFKPSMLEFHKSSEAKTAAKASTLWQNISKPVMSSNTNKFLKEMNENDIRVIESVAGDVLDLLEYERVYIQKGQELHFKHEQISRFNLENQQLKEEAAKKMDPEDAKRRQIQLAVINEIKSRLGQDDKKLQDQAAIEELAKLLTHKKELLNNVNEHKMEIIILNQELQGIDATIKKIRKSKNIKFFQRGERTKLVLETLRNQQKPLTTKEIAEIITIEKGIEDDIRDSIRSALTRLFNKGKVSKKVVDKVYLWELNVNERG